ncbi:hypothetical protein VT91_12000 [Clostridium sporogenes]|uniref:hypothetical protein n=1 Tax=Clostridium botulinum TaxID=1491 RepID=UPI0007176A15|nr:hypothetical protein [Clostridium botulinum]KRU25938.1 hypothetical protein WG71_28030 [Clostridium sporogenes]KRU32617.1 hypothetical protein VT91_12000 [Clostridium sporogenes]KRU34477.1 hypothetical protein VT28_04020 [Clostridium sporogenes]KRU39969.1 hypothetical protein VT95_27550 [Clostridium sporogenes]MBZ1331134.1 hypothetical protein [Clostridium botulinum]
MQNNKIDKEIERLDAYEDDDYDCFEENIEGKLLKGFSFSNDFDANSNENIHGRNISNINIKAVDPIVDNRKNTGVVNGVTPPVDGEPFTIKRTYLFRESTIRKLNQLKANSDNINIYLNTIVDAAINHYFQCVINNEL